MLPSPDKTSNSSKRKGHQNGAFEGKLLIYRQIMPRGKGIAANISVRKLISPLTPYISVEERLFYYSIINYLEWLLSLVLEEL